MTGKQKPNKTNKQKIKHKQNTTKQQTNKTNNIDKHNKQNEGNRHIITAQ